MLNRHLIILFSCQALYWGSVIVGVTLASLVGAQLAPSASLATLPLAILTLGNILTTLPISQVMQAFNRRAGFMIGAASGIVGGALACWAITQQNFWLFCFANGLLGITQASALYYRLAATDETAPENRGKAISLVMSGGVIAAIVAPSLAIWSKDLLLPHLFAGSYALVGLFGLMTLALCAALPKRPQSAREQKAGRPLQAIVRQPIFIAAIANIGISQATMVLIMIATPLAMMACDYNISDAAHVIQWHILGMFLPSFFSGKLIDRYGAITISFWGAAVVFIGMTIAISGVSLPHFYSSLCLLGIGWNFMYTAGSTLLTAAHTPEERGKVQGLSELITSCLAAAAAFLSGVLLHQIGWQSVNLGTIPLLLAVALITLWFVKLKSSETLVRE